MVFCEVAEVLNKEAMETEIFWFGNKTVGYVLPIV